MRNNLLQMSDRNQHCPLLAVCDLQQNQSCHRYQLDFPEAWYMQLFTVRHRSHCKWQFWIFHCVLDLKVIPVMLLNKSNNRISSLRTMGTAKDIWREPFTHPARSLTQVTQQTRKAQILSWSSSLHPKLSS
jgi:hypothetical protein